MNRAAAKRQDIRAEMVNLVARKAGDKLAEVHVAVAAAQNLISGLAAVTRREAVLEMAEVSGASGIGHGVERGGTGTEAGGRQRGHGGGANEA